MFLGGENIVPIRNPTIRIEQKNQTKEKTNE